jgi:uncharacterized protein with HEPN domain
MSRTYELYLRDILKAAERIEHHLYGVNEATFRQDELRVDAILFNLMIIGEAVKNIPDDVRAQSTEIRWRDISRLRDRIVHHYFTTDLAIIWEITTVHLPLLIAQTRQLLQSLHDTESNEL